ncbi:MAG TPA: hypothetical protein ENN07_06800 [candidate division Zixibacteria bacterium]|nr:hypothetical protein [candidate division Zixibacteria bacterium]
MRKTIIVGAIFALAFTATAQLIQPKRAGTQCRLIGGDGRYSYSQLTAKTPIEWTAEGPGYVHLYVRAEAGKSADFVLHIDGAEFKRFTFSERPSKKYRMEVGKAKPVPVTQAKILKIKLERGKRELKMTTDGELFARLIAIPRSPSRITPERYDKALALVVGDTRSTYYTGKGKKAVTIKYNGAGMLTVWTRLAFDKTMKGAQNYTVVVRRADGTETRTRLRASISETAIFENEPSVIPARARRFDIELPKGENIVEFRVENTTAPFCAFRFTVKK